MWKFPPFVSFLKDLVLHPAVGEIIIINNCVNETIASDILSHSKIKILDFKENIFVNPAWNIGVALSSFDNICLLSDDVIFDIKLLDRLTDQLTSGKMFVVNLPDSNTITRGTIEIKQYVDGDRIFHFGCLMFLHKSNWVPIPAGLNVYYGDSWLWDLIKNTTGENYVINDLFLYTPTNTTGQTIPDIATIYMKESLLVDALWKLLPVLTHS
jgi:hypothetical protein